MSFDPEPWRTDTPAVRAGRIHLNNAGASLMPRPVIDALKDHIDLEVSIGGYEAADAAAAEIEASYDAVARLVGAEPRNIAVVENATVAFAQALSAFDFAPGDVIATTRNDYISNQLMYLSLAKRAGVRVAYAEDLPEGGVDPASMREVIARTKPKVVAVTWVPTNSGLIQPVEDVGRICEDAGVPYVVDACQAAGQIEIDVARLRCDFLSATARKFLRGPRGAGFLFVSDRMLDRQAAPLWIDMRGARWSEAGEYELFPGARRFENWEFAYALLIGMGVAAEYALRVGVAEAGAYAAGLARLAREKLRAIPGARVLDRGSDLAAIVTVELPGAPADRIMHELRSQAIGTSATHRDFAVMDMEEKGAVTALRISPHYFNTPREIEIVVGALEEFGA